MHLSLGAAQALALAAQGLGTPPEAPATKAAVLAAIRQMHLLQIDSINVIARSPYLVLWSRLGAYAPRWLDELLAEGAIFEYWSHAACFLPREDYALYRRMMIDGMPRWRAWLTAHPDVVEPVRQRLRTQGEVRAADFRRTDGRAGTWWNWKPEKLALECLFAVGEVMCARRENFQRVYVRREQVRPDWDDSTVPAAEEVGRVLALRAVQALGVATARWVPNYFKTPKRGVADQLADLAAAGELLAVTVEGWPTPAYIHPANLPLAEAAAAGTLQPTYTTLLSPFDPLVSDRARALELFGFAYRIETYTRAEQRQHGYFTLPILHRGLLVGRLDPKAHRQDGVFEVRALHLEQGIEITDQLVQDLAATLRACAAWHETPQVQIRASQPPALAARLAEALQ
ncbi:MAG TPA: crosslink repair DNA glycosylase YcaQ family protein [Chloroflexia bacterium]|nr:crosslink repair DNA glycosylase YcaQ family protein [Chloroflexia bacterium]